MTENNSNRQITPSIINTEYTCESKSSTAKLQAGHVRELCF